MNNPQPWWRSWPPTEMAATILPLLQRSAFQPEPLAIDGVLAWCHTGSHEKPMNLQFVTDGRANPYKQFEDPDACGIAEAIQLPNART